jgi:hypothetical protein
MDDDTNVHDEPVASPCADCQAQAKRLAIYAATGGLLAGIGVALMILKMVAD